MTTELENRADASYWILSVNPGSTSLKAAIHRGLKEHLSFEVPRSFKPGSETQDIADCVDAIRNRLGDQPLDAVVGRGGFLFRDDAPLEGGVYSVADVVEGRSRLHEDILSAVTRYAENYHASNLGIPIAAHLAQAYRIPAFTVDPVVSDDYQPCARFSGYHGIDRRSTAHALSVKHCARKAAESIGRPLEETGFVIAHMGGGITVAAVSGGRMVDNNIALLGGGPFTPQRTGSLPMQALIDLCFSGRFTKSELQYELTKRGGLMSYLGESDVQALTPRLRAEDPPVTNAFQAMAYQVAKEIGAMSIALGREPDALVLTGGLTRSTEFMDMLQAWIARLAPILMFQGSLEMDAMAWGAYHALTGTLKPKIYTLPKGNKETHR